MSQLRILSLLLLTGCTGMLDPPECWDEFDPPHQYRVWHAEVQTCVGARRSFDDLVWRKVYATQFHCGGRDDATGCLSRPHTIYLAQLTLNATTVVKEELVHYVTRNGLHDALLKRCRMANEGRALTHSVVRIPHMMEDHWAAEHVALRLEHLPARLPGR